MTSPRGQAAGPLRRGTSGGRSRAFAALAVLAAALVVAFVVAPGPLAGSTSGGYLADRRHLTEAFRRAFVEYWRSGSGHFSPNLQSVVDYWFRYHVAKATIAAILLIVLLALGVRLGKAFLASGLGAGKRAVLASAGVPVTMLALLSLVTVMVNVQGAVAPFASLLPLLLDDPSDAELAGSIAQVRQELTDAQHVDGRTRPALQVMINDFSRYHVAMVVVAAIVAVALICTSVLLWRKFGRTAASDGRTRLVFGSFGVLSALSALAAIVVVVANTTNAADPAPALLAFFGS